MKVVVVGAGLGGMSAAIRLGAEGHEIIIVEQGDRVGGKLNIREGAGFRFDTGPSILTMPSVLESLFESAGKKLGDYVKLVRVEPEWRGFWPDGSRLDMQADLVSMFSELEAFAKGDGDGLLPYLQQARKLYNLTEKGFYRRGINGLSDLRKLHSLGELLAMAPTKTVHQITSEHFSDPRVQQMFDFLVMYVGSSPYQAPAILSQMGHVQMGVGVWYVDGGMYQIARAMNAVLEEMGATIHLHSKVERIETEAGVAKSVLLEDGRRIDADIIVCNLEVPTAYRTLLRDAPKRSDITKDFEKFTPSVSGLVLLLGLDTTYESLAHHNFFFSENPVQEFHEIFEQGKPASDPTIYIGVSARSDATQSPAGKDNLFILTHVPPLREGENWSQYQTPYRELVLDKLERMGLLGLRQHIEWEYDFTPDDLHRLYGSNGGSIYGVVSDRKRNGGFKWANHSAEIQNLYFVGGSTHPGGGVPMVTLSGKLTAELVLEHQARARTTVK